MGLIQRNGIYYSEFYSSTKTPKTKRYSLRTRRKNVGTKRYLDLERDYEQGCFDPWTHNPNSPQKKDDEPTGKLAAVRVVQEFIESRRQLGRSEETIRTYREVLGLLFRDDSEVRLNDSVLPDLIFKFVYDLRLAPATQSKRFGHVRTFIRWGIGREYILGNPLASTPQPKDRQVIPKVITWEELQLICSAMRLDYEVKRRLKQVSEGQIIWRIPLFQFAFLTGMRASELARMRWRDIDLELRLLSILEQKNGHQQTIPLPNRAVQLLASLGTGEGQEFVFRSPRGDRITRSSKRFAERSSHAFRYYRRAVGLAEGICFHSLRHGFCTALANAGKPGYIIKSAARHKDISTSLRYIHISNRCLVSELDQVFD